MANFEAANPELHMVAGASLAQRVSTASRKLVRHESYRS